MISVALCVTHADFVPARQKSMERLRKDLRLGDIVFEEGETHGQVTVPVFGRIPYREEVGRAPAHVWSERQWTWGAKTEADWVIYLQDDVLVAPDFWERLEAVLEEHKWEAALSFLTVHPGSRQAFLEHRYAYATVDGVTGNGYALSAVHCAALLEWREKHVVPGTKERVNEDVLLALFCMCVGLEVVTPLPGLIDQDLSVGTLHRVETTMHRRAYVRWDDGDRREPGDEKPSVDLGRFYETAHSMLPSILLDPVKGVQLAREYELHKAAPKYTRLFELVVAQKDWGM